MKNKLGSIVSLDGSPSTNEFFFVIHKDSSALKGQYVQVGDKELVFGYISEIVRANRYYEQAESVAEYEKFGSMDSFPTDSWEHVLAQVRILGNCKGERFERSFSPPSPGADVYNADPDILRKFLGFENSGIHLGEIQHHEVPANINMTRLLQKHLAILAMSGSGKSHLAAVMLEELLDRKKEEGRIAVVVVDIHGEYVGFAQDDVYGSKTTVVDGAQIAVPLRKIPPESIEEWLPHLSGPQRELLRHSIHHLRAQNKSQEGGVNTQFDGYSMKELFETIDEAEISKEETKKTLKRSLSELKRYKFLSRKKEIPKLSPAIKPGHMLVLDFSSIDSLRKKQILVALISRRLFRLRKKGKIPPFLLLIEEAHNFAREKAEAQNAISRSVIETIAREGRKFGASLCLISQRPVNLSTTALSQCNSHIILRVTNPNDLDHIQMSSEGIDSRVAKSITSLKVGEAILVGEAVNYPVFVSIRQRKSAKREKGAPLHMQAIEFEQLKEKKEEQVEAFL
jgi:DNA helicase HerA-like ATPase